MKDKQYIVAGRKFSGFANACAYASSIEKASGSIVAVEEVKTAAQNSEYWQNKGAKDFASGKVIVAWGTPKSWQRSHYKIGYQAAENEWRAKNPNKSPWTDR
jgi:hypothetical protein